MRLRKYKVLALGLVAAASIFLASTGLARAKDQSYASFETVENHTNQAALTMRIPKEQDGNVQTLKIAVKAENIKGNLDSIGIEFSENIKKNAVIYEGVYDQEEKQLDIYVTAKKNLFSEDDVKLGVLKAQTKEEESLEADFAIVPDSYELVTGLHEKHEVDTAKSEKFHVSIKETGEEKPETPENSSQPVKISKITLSKKNFALKVKKSTTLKATVTPKNATNKNVVWKSSNTKVAAVNQDGKVYAKKTGTATITCTSKENAKISASVKVTVADLKLNKTKGTLSSGKTTKLKAKVYGKSKKVTWKSKNSKIASVSKSGVIKGKNHGKTVITASANGVSTTFTVTVKAKAPRTKYVRYTIRKGKTFKLIPRVSGASKKVTWKSSHKKIATVSKNGVVKGKKRGKTTISLTANGRTSKVTIVVR